MCLSEYSGISDKQLIKYFVDQNIILLIGHFFLLKQKRRVKSNQIQKNTKNF
jgi:hypothetical protein